MEGTTHDSRRPLRPSARPSGAEHVLRWVLAHEPPVVFDEAADFFANAVREATDGEIDVQLFLGDEYAVMAGHESISRRQLVELLQRGEIEMAHCYVAALGNVFDPLWAIELPFLFRDYQHAERFFEGQAARSLMDDMRPLGMRGLGFAYSGGYRIVPTFERELRSVDDFAGLTLRTSGNPVPEAMYAALGARAIGADLRQIATLARSGQIEGCEITYVRYKATELDQLFTVVNQTSHSLFTTMTVVNEQWFNRLEDKHQVAIADAARQACRIERETAIREEQKTKKACLEQGVKVVEMPAEQHLRLRELGRGIHHQFAPRFGQQLIDAIEQA